jgi:hypothetical protein
VAVIGFAVARLFVGGVLWSPGLALVEFPLLNSGIGRCWRFGGFAGGGETLVCELRRKWR